MIRHRAILGAVCLTLCIEAGPALAAGPGFGNVTYTNAELFKEVSVFDNSNGTPSDSPSKAYGHNVAIFVDGYLGFLFAPDSGLASGGWLFYDVSDPRSPELVRVLRNADTAQLREPHSLPIAVAGDKTYVAVQTTFGIQIWDLTNPLELSVVGSLSLNGVSGGDYVDVSWQLSWQWPYLYVAGGNRGIYVVDTSDVTNPTFVKQIQTSQLGGFRVGPIFALGDRMFISNMDEAARYSFLDLRDPRTPSLVDTISTSIRFYSIAVLGDVIVGAGRDGDLLVHEVRNGSIESIRNHRIAGDGLYLAFQDDFIHYGQTGSYKKLSFADPENVTVLGNMTLAAHDADHGQTTPFGNVVFIGNDHGSGSALVPHQTAPDTTPPAIRWSFPEDGALDQPNDARLAVTFSDNVNPDTFRGNVRLETAQGEAVPATMTYLFNTLHLRANAPLADDSTYRFVVTTAVEDVMGNALTEEHQIVFSTGTTIVEGTGGAGGMAGGGQGGAGQAGMSGASGAGAGAGAGAGGQTEGGMGGTTAASGGMPAAGQGGSMPTSGSAGLGSGGTGAVGAGGTTGGAGGTLGGSGGAGAGMTSSGGATSGSPATGGSAPEPPEADAGGCSCRTAGAAANGPGALAALALAFAWFSRRRRRA